MVDEGINILPLLEVLSPSLLRSLGEQALQGIAWNLEIALVQRAVEVEHLTTREQEVLAEMASFEFYEQEVKEGLQDASAYLEVLNNRR